MKKKSRFTLARLRSKRERNRKNRTEKILKQMEKSSNLSNDDQLFFGFVFTLLIFVFELPNSIDFSSIFTEMGIEITASSSLISSKWVLISFLLFSSVCRYLTTFTEKEDKKNALRIGSVSFLLGCPYFIIADWTIRPLSSVLSSIHPIFMVFAPLVLTITSIIIGNYVEKKWNKIYGQEKATTSFVFSYFGLAIAVTYYIALSIALFVPLSHLDNIVIMIFSFAGTYFVLNYLKSTNNKDGKKLHGSQLIENQKI